MKASPVEYGPDSLPSIAWKQSVTLHNNFASKEALMLAVYEELAETTLRELREMDTTGRSEEARILAVFDHLDAKSHVPDYRGCPFVHASLQPAEPAGAVYALVHAYKRALRDHVFGLMAATRANRAELADQIVLLLDGAVTEAYLKGVAQPGSAARRAAVTLLRA